RGWRRAARRREPWVGAAPVASRRGREHSTGRRAGGRLARGANPPDSGILVPPADHSASLRSNVARRTKMLGYVTLGTNDLDRAAKFYDALLGELGAKRGFSNDRVISWSAGEGTPGLGVAKPYDGKEACIGNGTMVALACDS